MGPECPIGLSQEARSHRGALRARGPGVAHRVQGDGGTLLSSVGPGHPWFPQEPGWAWGGTGEVTRAAVLAGPQVLLPPLLPQRKLQRC